MDTIKISEEESKALRKIIKQEILKLKDESILDFNSFDEDNFDNKAKEQEEPIQCVEYYSVSFAAGSVVRQINEKIKNGYKVISITSVAKEQTIVLYEKIK